MFLSYGPVLHNGTDEQAAVRPIRGSHILTSAWRPVSMTVFLVFLYFHEQKL